MKKRLKNHFIPHEGNGYKPNSLQKFSVSVMFLLVLLTFAFSNLQAILWISSDWLSGGASLKARGTDPFQVCLFFTRPLLYI